MVPQELLERFRSRETFLLVAHIGLDGDHLGSMLALHQALEQMGKKVHSYLPESVPDSFDFLEGLDKLSPTLPAEPVDCVVTLECPSRSRLPKGFDLKAAGREVLNLDHHPDNEMYGDLDWVEADAAALGEMTLDLLEALDIKLDRSMAMAIYVAILTDTGSFQYSRVTPATHQRLAKLLQFDVPTDLIARQIYRQSRPEVLRLLGRVLAEVKVKDGVAWGEISTGDLAHFNVRPEETQFFVDDVDRVRDADVVALFRETSDGQVKVSLRSRHWPINQVAAQFGGGGHAKAAGCVVAGTLAETRERVVSAVQEALKGFVKIPH
jgi:phosphoesterase RecJ-like protein